MGTDHKRSVLLVERLGLALHVAAVRVGVRHGGVRSDFTSGSGEDRSCERRGGDQTGVEHRFVCVFSLILVLVEGEEEEGSGWWSGGE